MENLSDGELVARARAGSEHAAAVLVARYQRPLFALIVRMVRERALAEDLLQESLLKAFRALDRYDESRRFASWLFKIAHNTVLDHLRRRGITWIALDDGAPGEHRSAAWADETARSPESLAIADDLGRVLDEALSVLRPGYREILVLRFGQGLAYEEIAEVTGLPLGTVKTHLHRARQRLGAELERRGYAQPRRRSEGAAEQPDDVKHPARGPRRAD